MTLINMLQKTTFQLQTAEDRISVDSRPNQTSRWVDRATLAQISQISTVTALRFGRDAMNRIQNHKEGGIASDYDRHHYAEEKQRIMKAVATRIMALVEDRPDSNVVAIKPLAYATEVDDRIR